MLFDDKDDQPRNLPRKPKPLDNMSIEELEQYITDMKDEIVRVEGEIKRKKAHRDAVSSLFKS